DELAADIDVANMRAHRERGDKASLHQRLWIVPHDVPVLAGAGLGLISVDHEIMRPLLYLLRHEGPLQAGGKPGAAATAQAGLLDGVDDRFGAFFDELLGAVPGAAPLCGLEAPIPETVEVGEDAVLIREHRRASSAWWDRRQVPKCVVRIASPA